MAAIRIESSISDDDPRGRSLAAVIDETLRDHVGTWRAVIRRAQTAPWWVVVVERTDREFKTTLLVDAREQSPTAIREVILASLKGAV